jgi:hypothetical protein
MTSASRLQDRCPPPSLGIIKYIPAIRIVRTPGLKFNRQTDNSTAFGRIYTYPNGNINKFNISNVHTGWLGAIRSEAALMSGTDTIWDPRNPPVDQIAPVSEGTSTKNTT